ncbi:MAG: preprotein translocase subunit SecG [Gammaproteobacteria bacterium RIFCSPLOWO2_01_FULL_47_190]|nr:MAG: preprotein translocase subunit SecG [Gammaproteobacteria bacterium RIFCSPLOWO2_01_FULL_47_190]OGT71917.1 MAG: preprotein translocase subunit SecG [Gammaproteobacteria bacterium RIFCSPLOWO2_12_47_11]OGT87424.1 MAG: preprotein translocase subunit SecG [Gammaproteobacteria bacterium RIFCSPLOWO2_12_FULL_47_76]
METIQTLLFVLQIIVAITLIGFILIQHGKGADAGAAFGSGASATVFGSRGSGNFMTKVTTVLAVVFLANSLLLGYLSTQRVKAPASLLDSEPGIVLPPVTDMPVQDEAGAIPQDIQDEASVDTSSAPMDVPVLPEE